MTLEAIFYERDKVSQEKGIEKLILKMLTMHTPEEIAMFTGIDLEQIKKLQAQTPSLRE